MNPHNNRENKICPTMKLSSDCPFCDDAIFRDFETQNEDGSMMDDGI